MRCSKCDKVKPAYRFSMKSVILNQDGVRDICDACVTKKKPKLHRTRKDRRRAASKASYYRNMAQGIVINALKKEI